ncbi:uncharacterized protein A4U43_UnF1210 [Asparagus officinalis]|uniref:DYW domain-containing protein n=1 Tax=Asparagus officinalis TaxID=4686 RepID=A0A1R3L7J7_ASPOF|nr:uncharacterized protein A4U43_UnF1210 [Asparagus officinalis]
MELLCFSSDSLRLLDPNSLNSCKSLSSLKQTHAVLLKSPEPKPLIPNLIAAYGRFGDLGSAISAFGHYPDDPNAFLFNSLIQSHNLNSLFLTSIHLYIKMLGSNIQPNQYTFPLLFKACSLSSELSGGAQIHGQVVKLGYVRNPFVAVAVMDMYMKSGQSFDAEKVFDGMGEKDGVAWNAMVTGLVQSGRAEEALEVFERMRREGVGVGCVAVASVVAACSQLRVLHQGKWIHAFVVRSGFSADTVISTALLDMYANCGDLGLANQIFGEMHTKDLIAWNCLVSCYAQYGSVENAFKLFIDMQNSKLKPNGSSLSGILPAVARFGSLHHTKSCHCFILRNGLESDEFVITALMDTYAKSGDLSTAHNLFDGMPKKSVVAWSAIISGYGTHGCCNEALSLFDKMLETNIKPNHVTYVGLLSACVHSGFVDKGREYFKRMIYEHGITPQAQHFTCMVDLLSRAGLFDEAMDLINVMPIEPPAEIWGALLGGCKIHQNVELGDTSHPNSCEIYHKIEELLDDIGKLGYVPQIKAVLQNVEEDMKENALKGHSEKLAMAYGLLRTKPGMPIRIMKNLRSCEDCHAFMKYVSKITLREIVVRDTVRFHHIKDGTCRCGDYW